MTIRQIEPTQTDNMQHGLTVLLSRAKQQVLMATTPQECVAALAIQAAIEAQINRLKQPKP